MKSHDADVPDFNEVVEGKGGRELDKNGSPSPSRGDPESRAEISEHDLVLIGRQELYIRHVWVLELAVPRCVVRHLDRVFVVVGRVGAHRDTRRIGRRVVVSS